MRRRIKFDYWQEDSSIWSGQVEVIVPGIPDWKASARGFSSDLAFLAWAQHQAEIAMKDLPHA